jgi:hypothetical protein
MPHRPARCDWVVRFGRGFDSQRARLRFWTGTHVYQERRNDRRGNAEA